MGPRVALTLVSRNEKTGPIPVSVSSSETCPKVCPLKGDGCYAELGHISIHWNKIDKGERGVPYNEFLAEVSLLPEKQLWRHNVAGDLAGEGDAISLTLLNRLATANTGKKGFTYTHKPVMPTDSVDIVTIYRNKAAVKNANDRGFTVNLSANSLEEADKLSDLGIAPVVTILADDVTEDCETPAGRKVKICPAVVGNTNCSLCKLCQVKNRKVIIGFPAHGTRKLNVTKITQTDAIR